MAVHDHTYGHLLQIHQRLVITLDAHVITAVQAIHPRLLVTITTVSQETRTAALLTTFCKLMILFGMVNSAVQKVLAAAMDDLLHGLV